MPRRPRGAALPFDEPPENSMPRSLPSPREVTEAREVGPPRQARQRERGWKRVPPSPPRTSMRSCRYIVSNTQTTARQTSPSVPSKNQNASGLSVEASPSPRSRGRETPDFCGFMESEVEIETVGEGLARRPFPHADLTTDTR